MQEELAASGAGKLMEDAPAQKAPHETKTKRQKLNLIE
jgi:hypothetical protein